MRRLISDSTWAWQYCRSRPSSPGWSTKEPATSVPGPTRASQACSTTARPSPYRCASVGTTNGPWVRAQRSTRSAIGWATGSVKLAATPGGTGMPSPSRSRGTSSATAAICCPAIRTQTTLPVGDQLRRGPVPGRTRRAARVQLRPGERTGGAEQVEQRLRASGLALGTEPLQIGLGAGDDAGVEQLLQTRPCPAARPAGWRRATAPPPSSRPAARHPRRRRPRRSRTAASGRTARAPGSPPRRSAAHDRRPAAAPRAARPGRTRRSGTPASSPARSGTPDTAPRPSAAGRSASAAATAASGTSGRAGAAAALARRSPGTARRTGPTRRPRR